MGFPGGSDSKGSACNAGDPGSVLWLGRFPGEGDSCPLHYSFLENYMDTRAWRAIVHGVAESDMTEDIYKYIKCIAFVIYNMFVCCCCSVIKSRLTLYDPMECSLPKFSVLHYLRRLLIHLIGDAIQPSHPLSFPFLPVLNLS